MAMPVANFIATQLAKPMLKITANHIAERFAHRLFKPMGKPANYLITWFRLPICVLRAPGLADSH